jgi:hypothetical protein
MVAAVLDLQEGTRASVERVDHVAGRLAHAHDVVDPHLFQRVDAEIRQRTIVVRDELFLIAEHEVDLVHGGEGIRIGLRGAAGDDDAGGGMIAPRLADRLAGLTHRLAGDRTGVDDDSTAGEFAEPGLGRRLAHHFRFIGVEPAAEGNDVDCHQAASASSRLHSPVAGSNVPENSHSAGPVMMT